MFLRIKLCGLAWWVGSSGGKATLGEDEKWVEVC